jgi:hypothetical protein
MAAGLFALLAVAAPNPHWPPASDLPPAALELLANMPGDPDYPPRPTADGRCLGQLALYSFTPTCAASIAADEAALGVGVAADRAWILTIGRPEVLLASIDTGADWSDPELVARFRLNAGELPAPSFPGAKPGLHDQNGDGAFTVLDYTSATGTVPPTIDRVLDATLLARPDHGDVNHNGLLDPGDLIRIFTNGVDEDQNGYSDDIAGWDFVDGDNDPGDPDGASSHGARQLRLAAATANNGIGGAGVCPRCTIVALRAGTPAVAVGTSVAEAIAYAADLGTRAAAVSIPPEGGSRALLAAVDDARQRGTLVIAGAGNAGTPHQVAPWNPGAMLIAGSVGFDRTAERQATSSFAPDPCASFGAQLGVVAPGRCNEDPVGLVLGAAGLVASAALGIDAQHVGPLSPALSATELSLLLESGALRPPEGAGVPWSAHLGFGRVGVRASIDRVLERAIPIAGEIASPTAYAMIDPTPISGFPVRAAFTNQRYASASWSIEFAQGLDPAPASFRQIASGTVAVGAGAVTVTATVPTDGLFTDPTAPPSSPTSPAVTIRLVVSALSLGTPVRTEVRRLVFVHRDLFSLPDFPIDLGAGAGGSPRVLRGPGLDAIVVATDDGKIHAIDGHGKELAGWPVHAPSLASLDLAPGRASLATKLGGFTLRPFVSSVSVGRLLPNDTADSVVAATADGTVLVFDLQGTLRPGFPVSLSSSAAPERARVLAPPVLYDLDGDGALEIVIGTIDGRIHAFRAGGAAVAGFPVLLGAPIGPLAIGDVDGDGRPEIAASSHDAVFLVHGDGTGHPGGPALDGFPVDLPAAPFGRGLGARAVGAPLPLPPGPLLVPSKRGMSIVVAPLGRTVVSFDASGRAIGPATFASARSDFGGQDSAAKHGDPVFYTDRDPALVGLLKDAPLAVVGSAATQANLLGLEPGAIEETLLGAIDLESGRFLDAFPREIGDRLTGPFVAADLTGDLLPELVFGDGSYRIHAISGSGFAPEAWPKPTGGVIRGSAAALDLTGDGVLDVVAATREGLLFAWRTRGPAKGQSAWDGERHDARATGNLSVPTVVRVPPSKGSSCSCRDGASGELGAFALLGVVLLALRWALRRGLTSDPLG